MIDTEFLEKIWTARLAAGSGYTPAGIIPGVPVNETVKVTKANGVGLLVEETLPRDHLRLIQTPQLFATETLREAHREFHGLDASDDSLLVEKLGLKVLVVEGLQTNIKVTYQEDRERVSRWLRNRYPQI
jgi:2-C-methyl-D-erythritol 4-phosphate cytidylyltransferase